MNEADFPNYKSNYDQFPKKSKMIKESVFRGSLDNKMAARKASIWALFTQCSPYEYLQFTQTIQHGEKQTNDFLKCSMCIFMIMLIIHICSSMGFDLIERKLAGISTFSRVRLRTLAEYAQN